MPLRITIFRKLSSRRFKAVFLQRQRPSVQVADTPDYALMHCRRCAQLNARAYVTEESGSLGLPSTLRERRSTRDTFLCGVYGCPYGFKQTSVRPLLPLVQLGVSPCTRDTSYGSQAEITQLEQGSYIPRRKIYYCIIYRANNASAIPAPIVTTKGAMLETDEAPFGTSTITPMRSTAITDVELFPLTSVSRH